MGAGETCRVLVVPALDGSTDRLLKVVSSFPGKAP